MDSLVLSRLQFATTVIYHYLFVPLTLGLVVLIALMETLYVVHGKDTYRRMAMFWGQLYLINYALGIVSGLAQEFQFGTNWSNYSRFVGNVFGAPLAIETLLAFFVESTFLGIWIFGWDLLPRKVHLTTIWLVAFGAYMSVFWILIANSFMQAPVGYVIHDGQAYLTNFMALLENPNLYNSLPHVIGSGLVTAAFFVMAISAYHLRKKGSDVHIEAFQRSLRMGTITALIGIVMSVLSGMLQIVWLRANQPMKWAASIGLVSSNTPTDLGMRQLEAILVAQLGPGDYIPPSQLDVVTYHTMFFTGIFLFIVAVICVVLLLSKRLFRSRLFLGFLIPCVALPYIINICGWVTRETGRQPWIIYKLLTVQQGMTPNMSPTMVLISLITFALLYSILAVIDIALIIKYARGGVERDDASHSTSTEEVLAVV